MNRRFIYLAKLGILESTDGNGNPQIQRIDDADDFQNTNQLIFKPMQLISDTQAQEIFSTITIERFDSLNRIDTQLELQKEINEKADINITTCGNCGLVVLHRCEDEIIKCPHCEFESEPCDFPDLNTTFN